MPSSILLKNATLLLPSSGSTGRRIEPRKADLLITGNLIAKIEDTIATTSVEDVQVIDCTDKIISPGFIDTHRHVWQTQVKGRFPDNTLLEYLPRGNLARAFYEPEDIYWGTLVGLLESVDAGVTTVVDHAHMQDSPENVHKGIAAHVHSGIRSTYAYCPTPKVTSWTPHLTMSQDLLAPWVMDTFEELGKKAPFGENGRVRLGFAFDALFLPDEVVKNVFTAARKNGAQLITVHYVNNNPILNLNDAVEKLHNLSLLKADTLLSHANGITPRESTLLRNANAHVSATPSTETGIGLGDLLPATNPELCKHEHMSLGIDCHSYVAADMFTQMRLLLSSVRSAQSRPIVADGKHPKFIEFSTEEAFLIATLGGANAIGMGSELGSLEVGRRADLIIFDTSSPGMIIAADNDPLAAVVHHASVRDVETVIIDGKIRKSGGKLLPLEHVEGGTDGTWANISRELKASAKRVLKLADEVDYEVATEQVAKLFHVDPARLV